MQDAFVGAITCVTGLLFILGAAADSELLLGLHKTRWLTNLWGRNVARVCLSLLGLALIALGIALIRGWRLPLL
ncbi:hypothetical protein ETAA8_51430 [Anatilimnocola aggregata]|uniref:Uncharacterized protein n=1 Tax=Anatilimnocola aggregata TaxID=2528021 RepID=A0A517YII6_9BACT|nr:hypothetical protein [Anatilimnocola aggregata]QDU30025.1 hypothetical protein ETAA8_51430 [Anatilimnocola aggregata]